MNTKASYLIPIACFAIWSVFIIANYFIHHPAYYNSLAAAPYLGTLITLAVLSGGTFFLYEKMQFKLRGWMIYSFVLICMLILFNAYSRKAGLFPSIEVVHHGRFLITQVFHHLGIVAIFIFTYCLGGLAIQNMRSHFSFHQFAILSIAIGIGLTMGLLYVLGIFKALYWWAILPMALATIVYRRKEALRFSKYLFINPIPNKKKSRIKTALVLLVLVFISFNLIGAYKVFPTGFDGNSIYQNISNLIFENHQLVRGGQAYNWPLFTSIGAILFGKMSFSIMISHVAGLLCLWCLFYLCRHFFGTKESWLAVAIFYTLPAVTFHSFVDEKVDLGFLFFCLTAILLMVKTTNKKPINFDAPKKWDFKVMAILGFLLGISMGIKYLAVLFLVAFVSINFFLFGGSLLFGSAFLLSIALLFLIGVDGFGYLNITGAEKWTLIGITGTLGLGSIIWLTRSIKYDRILPFAKLNSILIAFFLLAFSPWMIKNIVEADKFSLKTAMYSSNQKDPIKLGYSWMHQNGIDFKLRPKDKSKLIEEYGPGLSDDELINQWANNNFARIGEREKRQKTNKREEIERYLGYEPGLNRYLSLPFDLSWNTNFINKRGLDIGFLFLWILPLIFLRKPQETKDVIINGILSLFYLFSILLSWLSIRDNHSRNEDLESYLASFVVGESSIFEGIYLGFLSFQDSLASLLKPIYELAGNAGFSISVCFILVLTGVLAYALKPSWEKWPTGIKVISLFSLVYGFFWWILGNGITYYAINLVALSSILLIYFINKSQVLSQGFHNAISKSFYGITSLVLVLHLFVHFTNKNNVWSNQEGVFNAPFVYESATHQPIGQVMERAIPGYQQAINVLNSNPANKIYKVGTYYKYHIDENDQRVISDDQLEAFNKAYQILKDPDDFIRILKMKGFKYILLDLNVASIDVTPEQTLRKKANNFVKTLNSNRVRCIFTDNMVSRIDPNTGQESIVSGLVGKTVKPGIFAIFEIL